MTNIHPIGHNNPPSPIEDARNAWRAATAFLEAAPAVLDDESARDMKAYVDRTRKTIKDVEAAQKAKSKPLHDAWKAALAEFAAAIDGLAKIVTELTGRLTIFARAEEARRQAEAETKRLAAIEAERIAREAEDRERELLEAGEAVDPVEADAAFADFQQAAREAVRAERDVHVKIGGGGGDDRALSLRTVKSLVLTDVQAALMAIGVTPGIEAAILTAARDYRRQYGQLPFGVVEVSERKI